MVGIWLLARFIDIFTEQIWPLIVGFLVLAVIFGILNKSSYSWDNQVKEKVIRRAIEKSKK